MMENQKELLLLNSPKNLHSTKLLNSTEANISEDPSQLRNLKRKISITEVVSVKEEEPVMVDLHSITEMLPKATPTSRHLLFSLVVFHTIQLQIRFPASSAKSEKLAQQE
jgi:hypothetical protein